MPQIRLVLDPASGEGKLTRAADGSLLEDDGLETAIAVSLYTDARASDDDGLDANADRRGYLFDVFEEDPTVVTGSTLWVMDGRTMTEGNLRSVEARANKALAWLVDERVATSVKCTATRIREDTARLVVAVTRTTDTTSPYTRTWELYFGLR